ncbi:hypothetical protein NBRC116586_32900 [Pseudooceanicola nitratireducens]
MNKNCWTRRRVGVQDLTVQADIGINPEEVGVRQVLSIDIDLELQGNDILEIDQTIDYRELLQICQKLAAERTGLIETFAENLASRCQDFDQVVGGTITVRKPKALDVGIAQTTLHWGALAMAENHTRGKSGSERLRSSTRSRELT